MKRSRRYARSRSPPRLLPCPRSYSGRLESAVAGLLTDVGWVAESLDALARLFVHASRRFADEAAIVNLGWNDHQHEQSPFRDYHRQTHHRLELREQVLQAGLDDGSVRPIGTAAQIAPHFRQVMWLPYQDHARSSERRAHTFIRHDVLARAPRSD